MKNIVIVGLGLIGASYALGLRDKYNVYGVDTNEETLDYALNQQMIKSGSASLDDFLDLADIIIFAIYPEQILAELAKHSFKEGTIITDVCGIKCSFVYEATKLAKPAIYCSHHPMAGREKIGIKYASPQIFKGANFLITPTIDNKEVVKEIKEIGSILGFGKTHIITPEYHDKMIGYTSTLTHAIAVALVNSDRFSDTNDFVGDSYRELTRIAMINSKLWCELFLDNKDNLIIHLDEFIKEIEKIREALLENDKGKLEKLFKESSSKRTLLEKKTEKY